MLSAGDCGAWSDPLDVEPDFRAFAAAELAATGGQPVRERGRDGLLYLFTMEDGAAVVRVCTDELGGTMGAPVETASDSLVWAAEQVTAAQQMLATVSHVLSTASTCDAHAVALATTLRRAWNASVAGAAAAAQIAERAAQSCGRGGADAQAAAQIALAVATSRTPAMQARTGAPWGLAWNGAAYCLDAATVHAVIAAATSAAAAVEHANVSLSSCTPIERRSLHAGAMGQTTGTAADVPTGDGSQSSSSSGTSTTSSSSSGWLIAGGLAAAGVVGWLLLR